jgi:hypothetical protein
VLEPPKPNEVDPAQVFRAMLARVPLWPIDWTVQGIDGQFFVRAIGSYDWVTLHRAIVRAPWGDERTRAEHALLAKVVVDANCCPVFGSVDDFGQLYEYEVDRLTKVADDALQIVSPTFAGSDLSKWIKYLAQGANAPENWSDMLSLSNCHDVSFGFGKGAVHVRDEPEAFFGFPRRELLDCHWFAYHAAVKARSGLSK